MGPPGLSKTTTHASRTPKLLCSHRPWAEIPAAKSSHSLFQETSNRLANQIPFIIQYFVLQENGDQLGKAMMQILQEKEHYSWLLQEQSETANKRRFLKEKIYRLTQARRALCKFSC